MVLFLLCKNNERNIDFIRNILRTHFIRFQNDIIHEKGPIFFSTWLKSTKMNIIKMIIYNLTLQNIVHLSKTASCNISY